MWAAKPAQAGKKGRPPKAAKNVASEKKAPKRIALKKKALKKVAPKKAKTAPETATPAPVPKTK